MNTVKFIPCLALIVFFGHVRAADLDTALLIIVRSDAVRIHFQVEVAATGDARRLGLMGRDFLAPRHGMWFDFEDSGPAAMWMKGTSISLDMLFVDESGVIVHIRERTEPLSVEPIRTPVPARYVLELNAGEVQLYAIEVGDRVEIAKPRTGLFPGRAKRAETVPKSLQRQWDADRLALAVVKRDREPLAGRELLDRRFAQFHARAASIRFATLDRKRRRFTFIDLNADTGGQGDPQR